jgi:hypothetical protein
VSIRPAPTASRLISSARPAAARQRRSAWDIPPQPATRASSFLELTAATSCGSPPPARASSTHLSVGDVCRRVGHVRSCHSLRCPGNGGDSSGSVTARLRPETMPATDDERKLAQGGCRNFERAGNHGPAWNILQGRRPWGAVLWAEPCAQAWSRNPRPTRVQRECREGRLARAPPVESPTLDGRRQ